MQMLYVMVLLYIFNGQVMFEKQTFKTEEACIEAGNKRIEVQMADPKFDAGLYANCVALPGLPS